MSARAPRPPAEERTFEGGCYCGGLRYRATGPVGPVTHCHCTDCRRSAGAPFVSWATFRLGSITFTHGTPGEYRTDRRVRTFCRDCGTSLTFWEEGLGEMDVTLASFDQPALLHPTAHLWTVDQLPWVKLADDLPRHIRGRIAEK